MRTLAPVVLLMFVAPASSAPAPLPRSKPAPAPLRTDWEVDFTPLARAGQVRLSLSLTVRTADGTQAPSVGQSGMVHVPSIVDAFARSLRGADLVINPDKTRMVIKSMKGKPILGVTLVLKNLDPSFSPVVLQPGR